MKRKLDEKKVERMRKAFARGTSTADLAERFGVGVGQVRMIVKGRQWKNAGGPISGPLRRSRTTPVTTGSGVNALAEFKRLLTRHGKLPKLAAKLRAIADELDGGDNDGE